MLNKIVVLTAFFLIPSGALPAEAPIVLPTVKVYANPTEDQKDELLTLKKGNRVEVIGVTPDRKWAKIKVQYKGFTFDGWVVRPAVGKPIK